MARSGWNSVSRHLGPIISPTVFHVSACACSARPPHSLSQEILASAKMCLVLEKWAPQREHYHTVDTVHNLEGCTGADAPWDVGGLWLRPQLLEQTLKFVFSHRVCESQCVRIKRKGRRRRGKCTSAQPSTQMDSLWGCWRKGFIWYWLFDLMLCLQGPSRRVSWEFSVLRYLFQGFLNLTDCVYFPSSMLYCVI